MESLTMTEPSHGVTRISATVDEVAAMLVQAGFPKDADRLLAAQAKRDRKAATRRYHAALAVWNRAPDKSVVPVPEYALIPWARS